MNLQAIANAYVAPTVNPNYIGTVQQSTGYGYPGDAQITGSIATDVLTVTAVASGALVLGSTLVGAELEPSTVITAFGTGDGGVGTYTVNVPQTAPSGAIQATGSGDRVPTYATVTDVPMNVQALSGPDLKQLDGLNIQGIVRAIYLNGEIEGLDRPDMRGGDLLLIPTGLSGSTPDVWLVKAVIEAWDSDGWTKVAAVLQMPTQSQ